VLAIVHFTMLYELKTLSHHVRYGISQNPVRPLHD